MNNKTTTTCIFWNYPRQTKRDDCPATVQASYKKTSYLDLKLTVLTIGTFSKESHLSSISFDFHPCCNQSLSLTLTAAFMSGLVIRHRSTVVWVRCILTEIKQVIIPRPSYTALPVILEFSTQKTKYCLICLATKLDM